MPGRGQRDQAPPGKSPDETDRELAGGLAAARLAQALEKDEFSLYAQPIAALGGAARYPLAEVLVRLREEENALLPPGEFFPVFEHYGMMPQLDRWVVRAVAQRLASGSSIPRFSVNLASQTYADAAFPDFLREVLAGLAPGELILEIDENDVLAQPERVVALARAAREAGAGLLVDGFGRRSVSFVPLRAIGPDFVKVDGAIVRKVLVSEVARTKLGAVLRVAGLLRYRVIAECVEEADILAKLKAMGVGYAQGFGVHRPEPMEQFAQQG